MRTYWNASVSVDGACKCSSGGETLAIALSTAVQNCVYYQAQYPSGRITWEVIESCAVCHNEGTIRAGRKQKRCPECKGKLAQGRIENIPFTMPDSANNIRLLAG